MTQLENGLQWIYVQPYVQMVQVWVQVMVLCQMVVICQQMGVQMGVLKVVLQVGPEEDYI